MLMGQDVLVPMFESVTLIPSRNFAFGFAQLWCENNISATVEAKQKGRNHFQIDKS